MATTTEALTDTGTHAPKHSQKPYSGLKVINAGLFRTATKSMARAYDELGYSAYHGLDDNLGNPWSELEAAAEATWPAVASTSRAPFTRADWDKILAPFDVCTDLCSPFVPDLIRLYPEAKVVIVKRDTEKWWVSFKSELLDALWFPGDWFVHWTAWHVMGSRACACMVKVHLGFFGVSKPEEITPELAKRRYEQYYDDLLEQVPKERRLVYWIGDGWEPLCEFLGKPVPKQPFPHVNDKAEHQQSDKELKQRVVREFFEAAAPYILGISAIGVVAGAWYLR